MNQTTQMHQISEHLPEYEHAFSPYYCDGPIEILRRLGLIEFTIAGNKLAGRCRDYLQRHGLPIDYQGRNGPYDLVLTCSDLFLPKNIRDNTDRAGSGRDHGPGIRRVSSRQAPPVPSSLAGGNIDDRAQRRLPGVLRRERRISRLLHPKRRAPREDRRHGNPQFRRLPAVSPQRLPLSALRAGVHVPAEGDLPARGSPGLHPQERSSSPAAGPSSSSFTRTRMSSAPPEKSSGTRREPWCSRRAARKR